MSKMKKITIVENRFEADLLSDALEAEGLDFIIRSYQDTAYDGLFVTQKGYAALLVNEDDEQRAKAVVEAVRASVDAGSGAAARDEDDDYDGDDDMDPEQEDI